MKHAITVLLMAFWSTIALAAPLTDFHNNIFQIDLGFSPNINRTLTNASGQIQPTGETSDFSGNLTFAVTDNFGLRLGATSLTETPVTLSNIASGKFGMTQANLQLIYNPNQYIQPFAGIQYAVENIQNPASTDFNYSKFGFCGGVQVAIPFSNLIVVNASGSYGSYMNAAYGGLSLKLGRSFDIDFGYLYEYYKTSSISSLSPGSNTALTVSGLRYGLSFRI